MSERVHFTDMQGNEIDANPENTALFRYRKLGNAATNLAMYDHVYIANEENGTGMYVFVDQYGEEYATSLTTAMIEDGYTVMLNLDEVAECDIDAHDYYVIQPQLKALENGVPEAWQ